MTSPDTSEAIRRLEENSRRLGGAVAFACLLTELDRRDEEARELLEEVRAALADSERERQAADRFLGPRALERLGEAERVSDALLRRLGERAELVRPAALRRALQRRPRRPRHELVDLLRLLLEEEGRWTATRVHQVDLLITRLGRPARPGPAARGGGGLDEILAPYLPLSNQPIGEFERKSFELNLEAIRDEIEDAGSLGELIKSGTLQRYRDLKHRLGRLLVHPDLRPAILETNLGLERKIQRLNSRAVTGIFSSYQGIFEIGFKGGLDEGLRGEIDQLQLDFDRFERRIHQEEVRLSELEAFWGNLRSFATRLQKAAAEAPAPQGEETESEPRAGAARAHEPPSDWLAEDLQALLDLLRESDQGGWPADMVSLPAREGFQIDSREVLALRRLRQDDGADRALETFVLEAAALRRAIKRAARKLAGAHSETLREMPDFALALDAVRLSESFLARYSQAVEQAILDGDVDDAQSLQILRMRLVRESAGIWLQVYQRA